jgi:iron-sulfur cluster assembly protein
MRALPPPITFTPAALGRLREIAAAAEGRRLRIDVRVRGCSGHSYDLSYVDVPQPGDLPVQTPDVGIEVLLARRAELFLLGAEVDYERTPLREGFVFRNPNEKGRCGCGESFHA